MRKITIEDLYSYQWVSDPSISPDGSKIAYSQMHIDAESKEYRNHIYLVSTCGEGTPRKLTGGPRRDSTPRWAPCGKVLAFVSDRSGEGQIWLLKMDGGEATQLTTMRHGASNPVWSPDGKKIAFTSRMHPTDADKDIDFMLHPMTKAEKEAEAKYKREHALVVDSVQYRSNDAGFLDGRHAHIWVMDIASGEVIRLTTGSFNHMAFSWSPDGKTIVLAANRSAQPELNPWDMEVWTVPSCGGTMKKLTNTEGPCGNPLFSPDGSKIAYMGHLREGSGATQTRLWVMDSDGSNVMCLTDDVDQGFGEGTNTDMTRTGGASQVLRWTPCGKYLIALSNHHGATHLYKVGLDCSFEQITTGKRSIFGWTFSADFSKLAIAWQDMLTPNDISVIDCKEKTEKRLTCSNEWLSEIQLSDPDEFWFKGDEGWDCQGWMMKPVGWQPGKSYPMIMNIHGGPATMFGYGVFHEFQVMAAQGYYVLFTNPRGGTGYGQKFLHGVNTQYGEGDYRDLMACVDYALENYPDVDKDRLGVTGGSYGGFMTNWIIGHTDRFKAAVTQRSISNWFSFWGISDIGYNFCDNQHGGNPLTDFDGMMKISPITYVKNMVTPLLIIHSEQDYRCPIAEGEQLFVALKMLGQEVRMVRFNNSTHELSRSGIPALRIDRLTHLMSWFNNHIDVNCDDYKPVC